MLSFVSLRDSIVKAIENNLGISPFVLSGSVSQRRNILASFESGTELRDQIMVMSMQESTSGIQILQFKFLIQKRTKLNTTTSYENTNSTTNQTFC